jgi:hypothetical protein
MAFVFLTVCITNVKCLKCNLLVALPGSSDAACVKQTSADLLEEVAHRYTALVHQGLKVLSIPVTKANGCAVGDEATCVSKASTDRHPCRNGG